MRAIQVVCSPAEHSALGVTFCSICSFSANSPECVVLTLATSRRGRTSAPGSGWDKEAVGYEKRFVSFLSGMKLNSAHKCHLKYRASRVVDLFDHAGDRVISILVSAVIKCEVDYLRHQCECAAWRSTPRPLIRLLVMPICFAAVMDRVRRRAVGVGVVIKLLYFI